MTTRSDDDDAHAERHERLSALMDGELSGAALDQACGHWRETGESRSAWHLYHVIGDVLRSDDLADGAGRQAGFLADLRTRLSVEPAVLAPAPLASTLAAGARAERRRDAWRWPTALAAGLVAAVGAVWFGRLPVAAPDPRPLALAAPVVAPAGNRVDAYPTSLAAPATTSAEPRSLAPGDPLIRDARLDRYLAAHQQFAGSSALGLPSGVFRAATAESARH